VGDFAVALLGATIYLLDFDIPNLRLAGLVDAGEGCLLMFLVWALFEERWWLLPLAGVLGALAKESFIAYSPILVFTWWLVSSRRHTSRLARAAWAVLMVGAEFAAFMILHSLVTGHVVWPWQFAGELSGGPGYLRRFIRLLADRQSWYDFGWLLPLGLWRLNRIPRPWVIACAFTAVCPLALSAYHGVEPGPWGRPVFSIAGPLLSLSVAVLFTRPASRTAVVNPEL
jgi:hypothetical protein